MSATALETDLYQITMMAGYVARGLPAAVGTFELFARHLPPHRNFLVAAGLGPFLDYLEGLRFSDEEVSWLERTAALSRVDRDFFRYLRHFTFTGDVWAMPEGTAVFGNEPLIRVTAPLPEAQLVETAALAFVNFQTSIASKAARIVAAAEGRPVMEFGARRAHGLGAALYAARAAFLAGCSGTSFVEAGRRFGIPLSGTMAHSWVLSADDEMTAFREYSELFGAHSVLLLDTYDTEASARTLVERGLRPAAVRIDSGDIVALSKRVRSILDAGGLRDTRILASGDLDEYSIHDLLAARAPVDAFGVGTSLVTSLDAPALGGVYKLVEVVENGRIRQVWKTSPGKETWPGRKQVWRVMDGTALRDVVTFEDEPPPRSAVALLRPVMKAGRRIAPDPSLEEVRQWCRARLRELPAALHDIRQPATYQVAASEALQSTRAG